MREDILHAQRIILRIAFLDYIPAMYNEASIELEDLYLIISN